MEKKHINTKNILIWKSASQILLNKKIDNTNKKVSWDCHNVLEIYLNQFVQKERKCSKK